MTGGQKMKYCSKCGNELFDEAVVCPKCGCPVENAEKASEKLILDKRRSHLSAGLILNNIAAIGNVLIAALFAYLLFFYEGEPGSAQQNVIIDSEGITWNPGGLPSVTWYFVWVVLIIAIFVVGLLIANGKKKAVQQVLGYVYIVLTIASLIVMHMAFPNFLYLVMCIWGLIFYVPVLLQIIAGIKFLQGAYKG